jgi:hypothetical protein
MAKYADDTTQPKIEKKYIYIYIFKLMKHANGSKDLKN